MEVLAFESFSNFMGVYAPLMNFNISYDDYHDLKLSLSTVLENNKNVTSDNFADVEEPDLVDDNPETLLARPEGQDRGDPEYKGSVEHLSRENKNIILETDDDDLVECTLQWLRMCNKNVQKNVMDRVVKTETKEEEEEEVEVEEEEEDQEPPDPKLPAPTTTSMECQTEESFLSGLKAGSSSQKEEPVPPEGSSEKEESGEQKTAKGSDIQHDDTAPKEKPVQ